MGMAASQARLLCITARIHDVEHQAQSIQHAKLQLGIQSDRVYNEYVAALDATTMTVKTFDPKSAQSATVAATFNNLCSRNRAFIAGGLNYAIHVNGWLLVEDEIEEKYQEAMGLGIDNAEDFAWYMLYGKTPDEEDNNGESPSVPSVPSIPTEPETPVYTPNPSQSVPSEMESEEFVENQPSFAKRGSMGKGTAPTLEIVDNEAYAPNVSIENPVGVMAPPSTPNEPIVDDDNTLLHPLVVADEDKALFNYFKSIFNQIQASGGCVSIADYGEQAANDSDWLKKMIESGVFTISTVEEIDEDDDGVKDYAKFSATSPSSDTNLAYTTTSEIDSTALKKAEAKYENDMRKINQKDKQFDLDLSKLETERSALTTQYDSIKKVIEDNIDRTFGIFS